MIQGYAKPKMIQWFWLLLVVAACAMVGVAVMMRFVIMPGFVNLERSEVEKDLSRCQDAIAREVYHLEQISGDWAVWDDTYQFVQDQNQAFLKANIDWPTLEKNSGLNLVMFCSVDGRVIWGEVFDSSGGGVSPVDVLKIDLRAEHAYLLAHHSVDSKMAGIVLTACGPMLISSRPVLKTDGKGPFCAVIIMGRFLRAQVVATLADQTKVSFQVKNVQSGPITLQEKQALTRLARRELVVEEIDCDRLNAYGVMNDMRGHPALLLKAVISRDIMHQGRITLRIAEWSVTAVLTSIVVLIGLGFATRLAEGHRYTDRVERVVEQRTAELREAQEFLAAAVAQSPSGILIADAPSGTIRLANAAALALHSEERDLMTGIPMKPHASVWHMFHPDGTAYPPDQLPLSRAVLYGETTQDAEVVICDKSGKDLWVSVNAAPIRNAKGEVTAGIAILHDITERKHAKEELQKVQRLRSIGTLAGGIAHDFNNILMALYGNLTLAKDELTPGHPGYKPLDDAERSMNRAVRLTRQLLTFARGGDPIKEDVNIVRLVEEVARFDLTGSNVVLDVQPMDGLWCAEVDKSQVQQVISNLTINAREAMPEGGRLGITLENADVLAGALSGVRQGKYIKLTVSDNGIGIDAKYLERIFEPYFTTKQSGSGLGLATTYSIVTKHGGHIRVESKLGHGTTFTLYLPASEMPQQPESVTPLATWCAQGSDIRILLMDDAQPVRELVTHMLRKSGISVSAVSDGEQAIALYKRALDEGNPFAAVIMDLTIPGGVGGKEAIRSILAIDPNAIGIVSSGYAVDPVMAHCADYGFKGVVAKPYQKCELLNVLGHVLKRPPDAAS